MTDPTPDLRPDVPDDRPRRSWRTRLTGIGLVVFVLVLVAGLVVRLPYYVLSPGSSRATESLISVSGAPTYDNRGSVDFLTVSLRRVTPIEVLASWINPGQELMAEDDLLGDRTPSENRELDLRMMASSKDAAQYRALTRLGYDVVETGSGAVIASVVADGPASSVLVPGDVVTAIDGRPISFSDELVALVGSTAPGTALEIDVTPFDSEFPDARPARRVTVVVGARPDGGTRGYLGVTTFTRDLSFEFPVQITIDSGSVGGPSAGLAFTLGILDVLTPGSISGGRPVAATGTMALDGSVGPVGGVPQKVVAAERTGVELLLVPASELEAARAAVTGSMRVEPVSTLDDALGVLATIGGGDAVLPPPPA